MGIEDHINSVQVTVDDLLEISDAVHEIPEEDRDWEGRAFLMAKRFKGQPHKAMSVDSRLTAMSTMVASGKLPGWALPEKEDGSYRIAEPVWEATATEKLIFRDNQPYFDEESFLNKLLSLAEPEGHA